MHLLRRVAELLSADAGLVHQPTLGDSKDSHTLVESGADGGRGGVVLAAARSGGGSSSRGFS